MVRMFDELSGSYDLANVIMSLGMDRLWRRKLVRNIALPKGSQVLDACTGTGDVALELARAGYVPTGVDASGSMLAIARRKGPTLSWHRADCRTLPFEDGTFDAVTISFGIRNIAERVDALGEFRRVVRPGGRLLVMEAMPPRNPLMRGLMNVYQRVMFPSVGYLYGDSRPASRYLVSTIAGFGTAEEFESQLREAGWRPAGTRGMVGGGVMIFRAARH